jgi:hypothetical protein
MEKVLMDFVSPRGEAVGERCCGSVQMSTTRLTSVARAAGFAMAPSDDLIPGGARGAEQKIILPLGPAAMASMAAIPTGSGIPAGSTSWSHIFSYLSIWKRRG